MARCSAPLPSHIGSKDPHALQIPAQTPEESLTKTGLTPFPAEPEQVLDESLIAPFAPPDISTFQSPRRANPFRAPARLLPHASALYHHRTASCPAAKAPDERPLLVFLPLALCLLPCGAPAHSPPSPTPFSPLFNPLQTSTPASQPATPYHGAASPCPRKASSKPTATTPAAALDPRPPKARPPPHATPSSTDSSPATPSSLTRTPRPAALASPHPGYLYDAHR